MLGSIAICNPQKTKTPVLCWISHPSLKLPKHPVLIPTTYEQLSNLRIQLVHPPGGGDSPTFWVGLCRTVLKTLTLFHTKMYDFSYPFSDLTPKIYTPFQTFQTKKAKSIPTYLYSSYVGAAQRYGNFHMDIAISLALSNFRNCRLKYASAVSVASLWSHTLNYTERL